MKPIRLPPTVQSRFLGGIPESAGGALSVHLLQAHERPVSILLDHNLKELEVWARELQFYLQVAGLGEQYDIQILPEIPAVDVEKERFFDIQCDRLTALSSLIENRNQPGKRHLVLLATPAALFQPCPKPAFLQQREIRIHKGDVIPFGELSKKLAGELGYYSEIVCETPGEFAVRGGLIDVYPLNANAPHRIDFFGDEVEQIQLFDPTTQRTLEEVGELVITAAPEGKELEGCQDVLNYLPPGILWMLREPERLEINHCTWFQLPEGFENPHRDLRDIFNRDGASGDTWIALGEVDNEPSLFEGTKDRTEVLAQPASAFHINPAEGNDFLDEFETVQRQRIKFLGELLYWQREKIQVVLVARSEGDQKKVEELVAGEKSLAKFKPHHVTGGIHEGFLLRDRRFASAFPQFNDGEDNGIAFISTDDILGRRKSRLPGFSRRLLPQQTQVDQLLNFSELADGDNIVHLQHGICIYRGLQRIELGSQEEEVITLEFDEESFLHVPLRESHLLTRYVGLSKKPPKLGRLGSNLWEKTRAKAEKAALDYAAELLRVQAERKVSVGHGFGEDHPWQEEFEQTFIFQETRDQTQAILAAKNDMQETKPMDRLVCGDVGFGKTEVAIRAAFRAFLGGKQVAILAPTTVLVQQHYNTFRERMAGYPVLIEQASRFIPPARMKKTLQALREGRVDILIGTHRLLSRDVEFRNLGLIIIDEEQRFGVKQKEKLKELRAAVDILTLSATPIPRTLYMALAGARDLSTIETPPKSRLPIQTIVKTYSRDIVKQAIAHETSRGGQVFYLHNKVRSIEGVAKRLREMFPKLKIGVGHGQMGERQLEKIMTAFVANKYHILVCTTIIESGLDIPNCNTLIIEGADRFGLAQLYQLRGRVGRFKRQAYAYLLLHRDTRLLDKARKRLASIRQLNQLGAGFRIAMRDLELRGAGNLLGTRQSGHIAGVGFDLYCQLLRQSISRLKGKKAASRIRASLNLDFIHFGEQMNEASQSNLTNFQILKEASIAKTRVKPIQGILPEDYLAEPQLRIDFYRRLAIAPDVTTLKEISEELKDRFGKYPKEVQALLLTTEIRCLAEKGGILRVETQGNRLLLRLPKGGPDEFIRTGRRFPRLTSHQPLSRLREIIKHLKNLKP